MKIKDVCKLEKKSNEIWVVSPDLYYDCKDTAFRQIVKANISGNTKYRYIVPNTEEVQNNLERFCKYNKIDEEKLDEMFLLLPESEFGPFMNELAIYNPRSAKERISCLSPKKNTAQGDEVVTFENRQCKHNVDQFRNLWKRYKRSNP